MRANFTKALLFALCLTAYSLHSFSQTYNLHWGATAWTAPTYAKSLTNVGGSGIDASVTITNSGSGGNTSAAGASADNNAFQYNCPAVGAANIAWYLPGSTGFNPLALYVDWSTTTPNVTTRITFTKPVNNVSFYLGDMDRTDPLSYVDRATFTGRNGTVTVPNPVVTKYAATAGTVDTVLIGGNQAYGNSALANGNAGTSNFVKQGATIHVQYSNPITELTIVWDNGPGATGNPAGQAFIIGDISFTKVIPLYPYPPTADNFLNKPLLQGAAATAIPGITAADIDGSVASYTIPAIPLAAQGVLTCCGGTAVTVNQVLTPAQISTLQFDPAATFSGTAQFTFTATDNDGYVSNTATYRLPVVAQPPVSNNIMANSMVNTLGSTTIPQLVSADADGTIASYRILSILPAGQGILYCCGGTAVAANQTLTPAQISTLQFDPAAGFTGNATFTYNATDNGGNISNTANYTVPVVATVTTARPPLANDITAQSLSNSLAATTIPALKGSDLDGIVASYRILSIPMAAQGVLSCCGGTAVTVNQVLTPAQAATLQFDPAATFTGTASFTYTATDNSSLVSNTATYNIPVVNIAPTAANINTVIPFSTAATAIPALGGSDVDGTISSYTVSTIPTGAQGVLSCCGGTAVTAGQSLAPAQAATLQFAAAAGFSGTASFTYTTTDNTGNASSAASYNISVPLQPPVTVDVVNATLANTLGATAISSLNATDADGSIASYTIFDEPDVTQGVLTCCGGTTVTAGYSLLPAQITTLQFNPAAGYKGLVSFKFGAIDNNSLLSNVSTYTIPVSGTGNIPPLARNIVNAALLNTASATAITTLNGSDADGTVSNYIITTIPSATQGVLTCCGGTAVTAGQSLTPAQISTLQFDPAAGFTGHAVFAYHAIDNGGFISADALYTIPVTSKPPVANPVVALPMPHTNGATAIPALAATDADGTIANYLIETIPTASQGVLTCCGGTAVAAGQSLTPAQISTLQFDPATGYQGSVVFNYHSTDNSGLLSNSATYTLLVTGLPPSSANVVSNKMTNGASATAIPSLSSSDADGSIASYSINNIPPASQGVLSCCGGTAVTAGQSLTPAQISTLQFDPAAGFIGDAVFNYTAYDNSGNISNTAAYGIPVGTAVTLASTLVNFTGERKGADIVLNWKAANESGIDRYEAEWSTDAVNYNNGGSVSARNAAASTYTVTLYNYTAPVYYLRLKSVEATGKVAYSGVVVVRLSGDNGNTLAMNPNPVVDKMNVKLASSAAGAGTVRIINMVGETVYRQKQTVVKGDNLFAVSNLNLSNGSYLLQVTVGSETLSQKFVVQK